MPSHSLLINIVTVGEAQIKYVCRVRCEFRRTDMFPGETLLFVDMFFRVSSLSLHPDGRVNWFGVEAEAAIE